MTSNADVLLPNANNDEDGTGESYLPLICRCPNGDVTLPDHKYRQYECQRTLRMVHSLYYWLAGPKSDRTEMQRVLGPTRYTSSMERLANLKRTGIYEVEDL